MPTTLSPFENASAGLPVGQAACELVGEEEAEPDRNLATQVRPTARQVPPSTATTDDIPESYFPSRTPGRALVEKSRS